jgi:DNA-binding NarL/FixJ family response regulator
VDYEWAAKRSRATLGEEAFAHAWTTGRTMSAEAIESDIQTILTAAESEALPPPPGHHAGDLTQRELEVLRLVAAGHTNREIAAELHLSPRTVHNHLAHILTKTKTANRTAASAFALRHGLA